jgi:hypothetical protein
LLSFLPSRTQHALNYLHHPVAATLNVLTDLPVNRDSLARIVFSSFAKPIPSVQGKAPDAPTEYVGFLLAEAGLEVGLAPQETAADADLKTSVA